MWASGKWSVGCGLYLYKQKWSVSPGTPTMTMSVHSSLPDYNVLPGVWQRRLCCYKQQEATTLVAVQLAHH